MQDRIHYFERLTTFSGRRKAVPMERSRLAFFKNWLAPVIYEMAQFPEFRPDAQWIAAQFQPALPISDVKRVMTDLLATDLVTVEPDGTWICHDEVLESGDNVKDIHLFAYHEHALAKASDSLYDVPAKLRHFRVLTSAAPADILPELQQIAQRFEAEVWKCLNRHPADRSEVWQIGLQMFPILQRPDPKPKKGTRGKS